MAAPEAQAGAKKPFTSLPVEPRPLSWGTYSLQTCTCPSLIGLTPQHPEQFLLRNSAPCDVQAVGYTLQLQLKN